MNTIRNTRCSLRLLSAISVAILLVAANLHAQLPSGQWDFNSSNLTATVGTALQYADGAGGDTALGTRFGTTASFGIPNIGGTEAVVMRFPSATNLMGYLMTTPAANGGGSTVNEYTIILDILYPASGSVRPLVDTDGTVFVPGADLIVDASGGIGVSPTGPFDGVIAANTWCRIGFAVTATQVRKYINGAEVGSQAGAGLDGRLALDASSTTTRILANTVGTAALGYVNSIQLRDVALNAGQMDALGAPSADGTPQIVPAVPSFIVSRIPGIGATGVVPQPTITVVLNPGDTTITGGSIQIALNGANLSTAVTPTLPTFTATATALSILDPNSTHTLRVTWQDSAAGNKTNTWSFTVANYQNLVLPTPFYLETFDAVAEGALPAGWTVTNNTSTDFAGADLNNPHSDSYKDFVVISSNRMAAFTDPPALDGARRLNLPPIVLNGTMLSRLVSGNFLYGESDVRSANQVQVAFTPDINCVGRSNVFVAWKSSYEQNQDNVASVEYSVNGGATWLPVIYYLDDENQAADIIRTNGVIDLGATFFTARTDQAYGSNYARYIGATVSASMIPNIGGRINDDTVDGKRIEVVRLPLADQAPAVRFRLGQAGTASWYFGIDDFGLYSINVPVITVQPQNRTISATESTTFSVAATSATPLTYQWQHAGTNLPNGGHFSGVNSNILTVSSAEPVDAGSYRCRVSNADGSANSALATLTVIDAPLVTTQPISVLVSAGFPASMSVAAMGRPPFAYQWLRDGTPAGPNSNVLTYASTLLSDAGNYRVVITNVTGATTSSVAVLAVLSGPITGDLVVHLKFDNNYTDSSGRGNNATPVGSPSFNAAGLVGQAFQYTTARDGSSFNYATLGYPTDLKFTTATDFSISYWLKMAPGSKVGDPPTIANKNWDSGANIGWVCGVQGNNNFEWGYREECPNTRKDFDSTVSMVDGQWHHVVVTFQRGGVARTFIDGLLRNTQSALGPHTLPTTIDTDPAIADNQNCTGNGTRTASAVNIGQDGRGTYTDGGGVGVTNATIDDLGIWRRTLTPEEAVAVYNTGLWTNDLSTATVGGSLPPPVILLQPTNQVVSESGPASFNVYAVGGNPLSYQWRLVGTNLPSATNRIYSIAAAYNTNAGNYTVVVSNPSGSRTSTVATLTVLSVPVISAHPQNLTNNRNCDVTFTVTAGGGGLSYQWKREGTNISGATTSALALPSIQPSQAGNYSVVVSNASGTVPSTSALLVVLPIGPIRLTGQWDFQNGDLAATCGLPLEYFSATIQTDTTFGTTTSFGIGDIGGTPAKVLHFVPSVASWGGYKMYHNAPPNGGGAYVNQYTLVYDVFYPTASNNKWRCFFQSNTGNANDGEFFVNTSNAIGVGSYHGNVTANAWHRIAFAVDLSSPLSPAVAKWIDGVKVSYQTGLSGGKDGRFSLDPFALLFGDEDGDQAETYVSSVQFWNGKLSDAQLQMMGSTTASKIPGGITARVVGANVEIYRTGNLGVEQTDSVTGPWAEVVGAANPLVVPAGSATAKFYRPKY